MNPSTIRWPGEYLPANSSVFVSNQIEIAASPEVVWAWLIRAALWPTYYSNASDLHFESATGPDLSPNLRFRWKTFGVSLASQVRQFLPCDRLAWDANAFGVRAYHAWLLKPVEDGCLVITEETQNGIVARLGNLFMPGRMHRMHQSWLEGLARKAETGMPPAA